MGVFNINFNMFNNINMEPETYDVTLTIGDQIQKQQIYTIPIMAKQEFMELSKKLAYDGRPCKIRFSKNENLWLEIDQKYKSVEYYIEFQNLGCKGDDNG